jgi:hypothetical protein
MHPFLPDKKVVFLHIPKAGGQTFYQIVRKNIPEKNIFQVSYKNNIESIEAFKKRGPKEKTLWAMGHMGFGLHRFFDEDAIYVTFLRDPVKRVISYYNFALRRPDHYLYPAIVTPSGGKMSLEKFVLTCPTTEIQNGQVRLLSSSNGDDNSEKELNEDDLARAMAHMENHFAMVGILELFDLSLLLMREKGLLGRIHYSKRNTAGKKHEAVSEKTKTIILENNRLDKKLYNCWLDKLLCSLENDPELKRSVAKFERSNGLFGKCNIRGIIDRWQCMMVNR